MNSINPESENVKMLCKNLQDKYSTPVIPVNCLTMNEADIKGILTQILFAFPIKEINIEMPKWITCLEKSNWLKSDIFSAIKTAAEGIELVREVKWCSDTIGECNHVKESKP